MMAESKFTPGPWRVEKSEAYKDTWRVTADGHRLASLCGGDGEFEETKANAELMADAPTMLGLLRMIHNLGIPLEHGEKAKKARVVFWATKDLLEKHGG
jgi:hypothetical protein